MSSFRVDPYEKLWMLASGLILVLFLLAVAATAFYGFHLPGHETRIDPSRVASDPPFANPGVVERAPGRYDVYMRAQVWTFSPGEIKIPAGSTVTFYLTSADVQHGVLIERTNINAMILPGHVTKITGRFDKPGVYRFLCHEYCGAAHQIMFGTIVVEQRS
ncbi:MAG: cytochrome c oxidase subunit II [Deltaproteobacteria bacterium]|nr:cytochrome c oxidase subunit II [Deltaproteobacteria bacterium]